MRYCLISLIVPGLIVSCAAGNEDTRQKICLNGVWNFAAAGTSENEIPKTGWSKIRVPSTWIGHGSGNFSISDGDSPHAWFGRSFFVPASWNDGRRIKLKFLALDYAHAIYVNGKLIDRYKAMRLCFDVDITAAVKYGQENDLAVWVQRKDQGDIEAGIIRSVYLVTVPAVHVEYSHALSSVEKMTLTVRTRVKNEDTVKRSITVQPVVNDNGKTVLTLPAKTIDLETGQSTEVESIAPWKDPVLWGFGIYGKPYLYHLRTQLSGPSVGDVQYDRFGFREFRIKGPKFYLNGKHFFVKGDLISRAWPVTENPNYLATYYQVMRSANLNFQRLHCHWPNNFDSHYWYEVGDELGHLVEAQMNRTRDNPDDPEHLALWTAYVNENFNHPSLVMWCPDNEGIRPEPDRLSDSIKGMPKWNNFARHLRKLDPTRVIDFHHGCSLYAGVKLGVFDRENYMTFNLHPYGSLGKEMDMVKRNLGFDGSVPIFIGEIFAFPAYIDSIENPVGTYFEQRRRGSYFAEAIPDIIRHGADGFALCALQQTGFVGYSSLKEVHLGPWSDYLLLRDETNPQKPIIGSRELMVNVRWPSLSGEGTKCERIYPHCGATGTDGGYGFNYNWFDPTRPMFYSNVVDRMVKNTIRQIDNRDEPALGPKRAPEVVVAFGIQGKPVEGAYIRLVPLAGQAAPAGVATDPEGTAWFHLWDTGRYLVRADHQGKTVEKEIDITERPALTGKAGYDYITWVDLGGIDIAARKAELAKGAEFTRSTIRRVGELIGGGDMEGWINDTWMIGSFSEGSGTREEAIKHNGLSSLKLAGDTAQKVIVNFRPTRGKKFKISGWIYKGAGSNYGCIGIRNGKWDWMIKLDGDTKPGIWKYVQAEYIARGGELYFYCNNSFVGKDGWCCFDDISMIEVPSERKIPVFKPGPFKPDKDGFIGDWLIFGPLPNMLLKKATGNEFAGFRTDDLAKYGGEANVQPKYGKTHKIQFPPDGLWIDGEETLTWRDIHSGGMVTLNELVLPERGITIVPPVNVAAYLACWVDSPAGRKVTLAIGSDDCHKLWLNGKLVGALETERGAEPDQNLYPVELKKGRNLLLVKSFQSVGDWKFCVRFLDEKKMPVTDISVILDK
jgi:hypothetical protein